jgi:hypothetical protein
VISGPKTTPVACVLPLSFGAWKDPGDIDVDLIDEMHRAYVVRSVCQPAPDQRAYRLGAALCGQERTALPTVELEACLREKRSPLLRSASVARPSIKLTS